MAGTASKATEEASKVSAEKSTKKDEGAAYVEYIPPNPAYKERVIRAEDWKSIGIEDGKERVWNEQNRRRIPESEFSDAELDYLERDGGFRVVDA